MLNFTINPRTVKLVIITGLVGVVILFIGQWYIYYKDIQATKNLLSIYQTNQKVVDFTKLFIAKVIKAKSDVSFEDRLKLENAVRDINDQKIFNQWQKFTEAKDPVQAQEEAKNLLEILANKVTN